MVKRAKHALRVAAARARHGWLWYGAIALGAVALVVMLVLAWRFLTTPRLKVVQVKAEAASVLVTAQARAGLTREDALRLINQAVRKYPGKQQTIVEIYDNAEYARARVQNPSNYPTADFDKHRLASYFHDTQSGEERWELPKK